MPSRLKSIFTKWPISAILNVSGTLTSKTTNFRRIDFCHFAHIWCTQKVLYIAAKLGKLAHRFLRKLGPNMAESEIFKPPYLPQMGANSPRSKTIFVRAARAIKFTGQIGGRAPPRGRTRKVGVGPKISNPNFSNSDLGILIKLSEQLEDHVYLHLRR